MWRNEAAGVDSQWSDPDLRRAPNSAVNVINQYSITNSNDWKSPKSSWYCYFFADGMQKQASSFSMHKKPRSQDREIQRVHSLLVTTPAAVSLGHSWIWRCLPICNQSFGLVTCPHTLSTDLITVWKPLAQAFFLQKSEITGSAATRFTNMSTVAACQPWHCDGALRN